MSKQFGDKIKELREKRKLFLRQVAAQLDMDTAQLSKIEKGTRQLKREQLSPLANILLADLNELQTLWLADQLLDLVKDEPNADEALKSVSKKIKKLNNYGTTN
ncbi:MAG TPA: helix-turn-helix transcriptional regulator [Agriterribacter sp.]|nr:helix-turn-helix domain-containing protein [Chitinophagaceae bacterium]HRP33312.1 helix-turn-helix transcriptional regulator [Agriterribacter sp.]